MLNYTYRPNWKINFSQRILYCTPLYKKPACYKKDEGFRVAEYSNFVCSNQIFASKSGLLGKKVLLFSKWRSNQQWHFICVDTICQKSEIILKKVLKMKSRIQKSPNPTGFSDLKTSKWSLYYDGANQKSIKHYLLEWLYSPVIDLFPLKMGFASKQNNSRQLGNTKNQTQRFL